MPKLDNYPIHKTEPRRWTQIPTTLDESSGKYTTIRTPIRIVPVQATSVWHRVGARTMEDLLQGILKNQGVSVGEAIVNREFKKYILPTFQREMYEWGSESSSIIIFHLGKRWKAEFFILCEAIFLVRMQGNLILITLWSEKVNAEPNWPKIAAFCPGNNSVHVGDVFGPLWAISDSHLKPCSVMSSEGCVERLVSPCTCALSAWWGGALSLSTSFCFWEKKPLNHRLVWQLPRKGGAAGGQIAKKKTNKKNQQQQKRRKKHNENKLNSLY